MGNYLSVRPVLPTVMAARPDPRDTGVGMAHLTVVPANADDVEESEDSEN